VVLTEWDDIGEVLAASFTGILAMFFLVVYLEKWLTGTDTTKHPKR
jgi:hypothetical protein